MLASTAPRREYPPFGTCAVTGGPLQSVAVFCVILSGTLDDGFVSAHNDSKKFGIKMANRFSAPTSPLLTIICLLLQGMSAYAQKDTVMVWNQWCERTDTEVLFLAANNTISVYSPGTKPGDLVLKSLDKTLKISGQEISADTLSVLAMPYTADKPMRLAISSKKTGKLLKTVFFNGATVPVPNARLGRLKDTLVPKVNVLAQVGLRVYFPNSLYSYPYRVTEYTFKVAYDKVAVNLPVKGYMVTRDVEQAIKNAPVGAVLEFTDIKATCPECVTRSIPDYRIKLAK